MPGWGSKLANKVRVHSLWFCLILSSPALAEVSDKVPDAVQNWLVFASPCVIAFMVATIRPWFALLILPVSSLLTFALLDEFHDPNLGPAIREELGEAYLWQAYIAAAIGMIGPPIAWATLKAMKLQNKR